MIDTIASTPDFPEGDNSRTPLQTYLTYLEMPVSLKAADIEVVLNRTHYAIMTNSTSIEDCIAEINEGY